MNVFIDTNILLGFYSMSGPDLDELQKIILLAENGKLRVLVSSQVFDEFWRNRERVVSEATKQFSQTKVCIVLPNLIRVNPKSSELRSVGERFNTIVKELRNELDVEIASHKLKADEVINALFLQCKPVAVGAAIIDKAKLRRELGNPPGKNNSLGDAVNWEWLLDVVANGDDLIVISSDGDFESELLSGKPKEFLLREWREHKKSEVVLYSTLPDFFRENFPDIRLSEEIDKVMAIERLENSSSFWSTHKAIEYLGKIDDFSESDLHRIVTAYTTNQQIHWILSDSDVLAFANKILSLSSSEDMKEHAKPLFDMVNEISI